MAKRQRTRQREGTPPASHSGAPRSGQGLPLATLIGVMALLTISFLNWRQVGRIEGSLDGRLGEIESDIARVADKVEALPAQAAQPTRPSGPDPDRAYTISTAGAPAKGPASAAVTIAEFSDSQ